MRRTKSRFRPLALALALVLILSLLLPLTAGAAETEGEDIDLSAPGLRIGVAAGTDESVLVSSLYPEAEISYLEMAEGLTALRLGKLDCYLYDRLQMALAIDSGLTGIRLLVRTFGDGADIALGISDVSEIPDLKEKVNACIAALRADGTLEDMYARWALGGDAAMPEIPRPEAPEYTLTVATSGIVEPYSFYADGVLTGYDIELSYRLGAWLNASVTFEIYDYESIVGAALTGKADIIAADLEITPERAEVIDFSDPVFRQYAGIAVRDTAPAEAGGLHWQDYIGKRIGVLTGTLMEAAAETYFPGSEYYYYNSYPDCNAALLAGHIDAYLGDEPGLKTIHAEQPEISYIPDRLTTNEYSFAFRKDDPASAALCAELNAFLAESRENGTMQELDDIWFGVDEARKVVDMSDLTGENGTVRVVTTSTDMPFSYIKDGKNVGYDIDLAVRFCRARGYALELGDVDFAARIPAIQSGKYDFTTDMNVTPERMEEVLFSDPVSSGGIVLAVLTKDLERTAAAGEKLSFFESAANSFHKTFIREGRWKLFLEGIGTTLLITVLSVILGTALGFGVYLLCRSGNPPANVLTRFFRWLLQGMPMVVLLMILYYIIFASSPIDGAAVAVIAFTLVFAAAVIGMLQSGVGAVDRGQTEAAYALGYGNSRTFFRIVLPQAIPHFFPAYKGEIAALVKATAIVGYIAVQDLTKMGDIVRGRTYEPFFPLIAVAVIYYILAAILTFLVGRLELGINPRRRKRESILKGVKTDD